MTNDKPEHPRPFNRLTAIDRTTELWAIRRYRKLTQAERDEFWALAESLILNEAATLRQQRQMEKMPARQERGIH